VNPKTGQKSRDELNRARALSEDRAWLGIEVFSSEFKRQIAKEFLDGRAGLHELARQHSLSRNLIRLWIRKYESGGFTDELAEAVHIAQYERKIAELERKVGQTHDGSRFGQKRGQLRRPRNEGSYSIVSSPKPSTSHEDAES
jgi:transposase